MQRIILSKNKYIVAMITGATIGSEIGTDRCHTKILIGMHFKMSQGCQPSTRQF
jgi:hypothetical protein